VSALQNDTTEKTTRTRVCEIIDGHFKGDIEHVTVTLSSLWDTLNQDCYVVTPPDVKSSVRPFPTHRPTNLTSQTACACQKPRGIEPLQRAIMKSIHGGVFFDRRYWVRHSRNGGTLKAIYSSSIIADDGLEVCEFSRADVSVCS